MTLTSDPGMTLTSEAEDLMTSVIPPETLSEVLRQAFGLSKQRAAKYERLLLEPYKKKTHAKVNSLGNGNLFFHNISNVLIQYNLQNHFS